LLIDNRTNKSADYHNTVATSAQGMVSEVDVTRRGELLQLYLDKHPDLSDFVSATDCVLLKLEVESFHVVSQFQNVAVLQMF
jgi:hypothetical protein